MFCQKADADLEDHGFMCHGSQSGWGKSLDSGVDTEFRKFLLGRFFGTNRPLQSGLKVWLSYSYQHRIMDQVHSVQKS